MSKRKLVKKAAGLMGVERRQARRVMRAAAPYEWTSVVIEDGCVRVRVQAGGKNAPVHPSYMIGVPKR